MRNAGNNMSYLKVDIKQKSYSNVSNKTNLISIKDLQFTQSNNEFICIIGPSGCGKTTLLNIIAGLDSQYDGSIEIQGQADTLPTSYVFQQPRLLPWRTVFENIELSLPDNADHSQHIYSLLETLGLGDFAHTYPNHLSLGMARRAALARAFANNSSVLLMDEPFVSLDQTTAKTARKLLLDIWNAQPRNILFVTHDLLEAIELADRVLFLSAAPCQIIADIAVNLPRDERSTEKILEFKASLASNKLLTGFI